MDELFVVWLTDGNTHYMPMLYEVCIISWQVLNPDLKIVLYTNDENLKCNLISKDTTEVRMVPDDIMTFAKEVTYNTLPSMKLAHQCDIIRYHILMDKGGIAIDADLICISPLNELLNTMRKENKSIVFGYEDYNRIGIALMTNLDCGGTQFYKDILAHYNDTYIKTSWLYNSIKYPMLIANRYKDSIYTLLPKFNWHYPNGLGYDNDELCDVSILMQPNMPDCICGYGIHLYSGTKDWQRIRTELMANLYTDNLDWWILKYLNQCIDEYIDLMRKADYRDVSKDTVVSNMLTDLYGNDYVNQFKKEM